MLRILVLIIIGWFIYRLFKTRGITWPGEQKSAKKALKPEPLVQDPVCKTYVMKEKAIEDQGNYFCGTECRDKFRLASKET